MSSSDSRSSSDYESSNEETSRHIPVNNAKEVRLNRAILMKGITSVNCDKREPVEVDKQFPRVTHLHLQNKGIDILGSLHHFRNLTVLYLYDNRIREIVGLEDARQLEALYLQRNRLDKISGLLGCRRLRKLYLGQNSIMVVEGLQLLTHLEELHVEQQRLRKGEQLIFDPTTLDALSTCLQVLNISGNAITTLDDLAGMTHLHTLSAQDNNINDLERSSLILMTLQKLKVVDLRRNPVAKSPKYEEKVIGHCESIELLDGKTYSTNSRQFMTKFCEMKALHLRRSLASMDIAAANSKASKLSEELTSQASHSSASKSSLSQSEASSMARKFEREGLDRGLSRTNLIGQYADQKFQSKSIDPTYKTRHELKLVKPQEISLPQFQLINGVGHIQYPTSKQGSDDAKGTKSKIFKGLGDQGFAAITNLPPNAKSGKRRGQRSSYEGMMPLAQSLSKSKLVQAPEPLDEAGDSKVSSQDFENPKNSWKTLSEPKVVKLPPWPHILRNLGSTEKINFI